MRKGICCVFAFVSSFCFSQQKEIEQDKLDIGFRFGLSMSDVISPTNTVSPRATFLVGAHMEYIWSSKWSLQPELLYVRKGESARGRLQPSGINTEERLLLDYLELPILAKYQWIENFFVEAGPYVSYLVSAKQEQLEGTSFQSAIRYQDSTTLDAGVAVGISYTTDWNIFLGLRYSRGFVDLAEVTAEGFEELYNTQFQMYIGYSF